MFYFSDQTESQKLNERLAKIFNSVPSGIGLYEIRDGKIVQRYMNDEFHRMLHDTRENRRQYSGENFLNAVHPDDLPAFRTLIDDVLHGTLSVQMTYRIKNGDKKWVWLRVNGKVVEDDQNQKIIYCSFFDVDEQTQTQLFLKEEQARLKMALQTAKMDFWEYDVQQQKVSQTDGFQNQHTRIKEIENVPESLIQGGYIHPDSIKEYRRLFLPATNENDVRQADIYVKTPGKGRFLSNEYIFSCWSKKIRHILIFGVQFLATAFVLVFFMRDNQDT